jgi:hypothetical protein
LRRKRPCRCRDGDRARCGRRGRGGEAPWRCRRGGRPGRDARVLLTSMWPSAAKPAPWRGTMGPLSRDRRPCPAPPLARGPAAPLDRRPSHWTGGSPFPATSPCPSLYIHEGGSACACSSPPIRSKGA